MSMARENYFETLKLEKGVSNFTVVQDRAVRRTSSPAPYPKEPPHLALRDALVSTSATKFSIDECDEPLYRPTRQLSSSLGFSSESIGTDSLQH
jgi:hypothetical protein